MCRNFLGVGSRSNCFLLRDNALKVLLQISGSDLDLLNINQTQWGLLPDIILEQIFSYLNMREKYYASMVCRTWNSAFYLPYSWSTFVFDETTLTRRRFNYYSGWQHTLDHLRTQMCLATVGRNFKVLIFNPMTNFYNMYEFMSMISYYAEQQGADKFTVKGIGNNIRTLRYTFPCNLLSGEDDETQHALHFYGTGGKLLAAVKRLMGNLKNLRCLELTDLMLDNAEAQNLLDDVCCDCCATLRFLSIINFTKGQCQLLHMGVFVNLQILVVSPQNIGDSVLELLSFTKLKHFHLAQTRLTPSSAVPLSARSWRKAVENNKTMNVHLTLVSKSEKDLLWQENAPVSTILFDSPHSKLRTDLITRVTLWYRDRLSVFGHLGLPKYAQPKSFTERMDAYFVMMVKDCPLLHTLVMRERMSTATILLVAHHAKALQKFYVRKNAIIKRCDWPRNPSWDEKFYSWLQSTSQSYESTEKEVATSLRLRYWKMLNDKEFKDLTISLY